MSLLAIDPGATTGFAYTDGRQLDYGSWKIRTVHPGDTPLALYDRVLTYAIEKNRKVKAIVTEGGYPISRKGADRLEWLRGAVQMAGAALCVPVYVVAPSTLKAFATGHGGATKADMLRACELTLGIKVEDDNICDAIFLLEWLKRNPSGVPTKAAVKRAAKKRRTKQPNLFPKER